jgi:biotin carboxyl carrier protein
MPEAHHPGDRSPARREADHASLARLSETLVPALVAKLNASGLGELEVREGDWRIRLRRPVTAVSPAPAVRRPERARPGAHLPDRESRAARAEGAAPADPGVAAAADVDDRLTPVRSPAVGVFRPDASPGARVRAGDRIGIVDLLGIPQDVAAPVDGTLVELLVAAGEAVEYGETIAIVAGDPAGSAVETDASGPGEPGEG